MAKVNTPKIYLGNYVKFSFEKIIERHSSKGEWKYVCYINDSKNIFVQMPNGDIIDYSTNKKINAYDFDKIDSINTCNEETGVTNLIAFTKFYTDIHGFINNSELILNLINYRLEQSNSWINKENLTLNNNGTFSYSGHLTENQKIVMTFEDNFNTQSININDDDRFTLDIDDDLYVGFIVEREMKAYYTDDLQLIDSTYLAKDVLINMLSKVKLLKKYETGYIDVKNNTTIKEINAKDLNLARNAGYKFLEGTLSQFYIAEEIGICNIIKLSDFLNNLGGTINPDEDIEAQINKYYEILKKLYMYDKIPEIKYPEIQSVLKRSLTIGKKVN